MSDYYYEVTNLSQPTIHFMHITADSLEEAEIALNSQLSDKINFLIEEIVDVPETPQKPPKKRRKREPIHF